MEHSRQVYAHDKVFVAFNAHNENYLNYETSINGILLEVNACVVLTVKN